MRNSPPDANQSTLFLSYIYNNSSASENLQYAFPSSTSWFGVKIKMASSIAFETISLCEFVLMMMMAIMFNGGSCGIIMNDGSEQVGNNVLNSSPPARISGFRAKDWIKISQAPSKVINARYGEKIELECEVLGSPAPEIEWFRGNQLIQQTERNAMNNEFQNSLHDKAGLAKIKSRLLIDCVSPTDEGFYTCLARAGTKKVKSEQSLLLVQGGNPDSCEEPQGSKRLQPPRIIGWNPTAMENMGVDVLLPCTAIGNPPPEIYWLDQEGNVVDNFRYRVMSNGDLAIYRLAWPDMGQYKCVAENSLGRDSVTTFVYPVLSEK